LFQSDVDDRDDPVVAVDDDDLASLARPGSNLTGVLHLEAGIVGKWLAMLKEIAPRLSRVALLANPKTTSYDYFMRSGGAVASSLAIDLLPGHAENAADIERTIEAFARVPNGGLALPPDATTVVHRDLIITLAARHRLPAIYPLHVFAAAGGLMSYGAEQSDLFRLAASYVDRILRGDKPTDLPVQAPTKYETVINLKTAKVVCASSFLAGCVRRLVAPCPNKNPAGGAPRRG